MEAAMTDPIWTREFTRKDAWMGKRSILQAETAWVEQGNGGSQGRGARGDRVGEPGWGNQESQSGGTKESQGGGTLRLKRSGRQRGLRES